MVAIFGIPGSDNCEECVHPGTSATTLGVEFADVATAAPHL
jgi:hypothetical protein